MYQNVIGSCHATCVDLVQYVLSLLQMNFCSFRLTILLLMYLAYNVSLVPSLSSTVEQIRPVNGLTRLVRSVQVVKQWFTSRTGRGAMVSCTSLVRRQFILHSTPRTTRTGRTGRETMVYDSNSW